MGYAFIILHVFRALEAACALKGILVACCYSLSILTRKKYTHNATYAEDNSSVKNITPVQRVFLSLLLIQNSLD